MNDKDFSSSIRSQFRQTAKETCQLSTGAKVAAQAPHNLSASGNTNKVDSQWSDQKGNTKSSTQVESSVSPQCGVTNSGGLKPKETPMAKRKNIRRRANPFTVRLSEKDRAISNQKVLNIGCNVNAYTRAAALGSQYKPPISRDMVMALLADKRELPAQGRNLNQIADSHNSNIHSGA